MTDKFFATFRSEFKTEFLDGIQFFILPYWFGIIVVTLQRV